MDSEGCVQSPASLISQRRAATRQPSTGFEQARTYLQQLYNPKLRDTVFTPEDVIICRISGLEWSNLCAKFDLDSSETEKWPRFSYNSATSTLKIYTMASGLHEITISFLYQHLIRLFDQAFSKSRRDRITICTNLKVNGFTKEYRSSIKTPDLGIFVKNDDNTQNELKLALEIGFSQKYDDLQEDLRLWLVGQPACSMVVLINITESPKYQCPIDFDLAIGDKLNIPREGSQITAKEFSLEGEYGPVMFKGYQWIGQISEVFLEIWTRNTRTGELRRKGRRMPIIPPSDPSPQLDLADFLFDNHPQMTFFDWEDFRAKLKDSLRFQAVWRCREWLRISEKRAGSTGDRSYSPRLES